MNIYPLKFDPGSELSVSTYRIKETERVQISVRLEAVTGKRAKLDYLFV